MVREFERYGLSRYRTLTGVLQLAGSAGLIAGYCSRPLLLLASGGLAALMCCGVFVRFWIRDPLYAAIPALTFLGINLYIFAHAFTG
jgi:hypothetical protein